MEDSRSRTSCCPRGPRCLLQVWTRPVAFSCSTLSFTLHCAATKAHRLGRHGKNNRVFTAVSRPIVSPSLPLSPSSSLSTLRQHHLQILFVLSGPQAAVCAEGSLFYKAGILIFLLLISNSGPLTSPYFMSGDSDWQANSAHPTLLTILGRRWVCF